ncbi:unnamed protein product [Coregonus sp. 'balchen']|nr:unnamed protein product [Coregonus sp. 'balchen']
MRLELCVVLYIMPLLVCVFCYLNFILILNRTPNLPLLLTLVNTVLDPVTFYFSSSTFQATMKRILTGKRRNSSPGVFITD